MKSKNKFTKYLKKFGKEIKKNGKKIRQSEHARAYRWVDGEYIYFYEIFKFHGEKSYFLLIVTNDKKNLPIFKLDFTDFEIYVLSDNPKITQELIDGDFK